MGKIYNNIITTTAGFNYPSQQPLDDRAVVQSYEDLGTLFTYEGIEVFVVDTGKSYKLIDGSWRPVATELYVDEKIASLVNSAPETLDTLGELATALEENKDVVSMLKDSITNKVDKVEGKDLSSNDYTTAEQEKLAGIATGAEVNVQSDWNENSDTSDAFINNKPAIKAGEQEHSVVIGDTTSNRAANYALAEGNSTDARGESSHAEGIYTIAEGPASHAEGSTTSAVGTYSHAEGEETHAIGYCSHAEGKQTNASGESSHAEGDTTISSSLGFRIIEKGFIIGMNDTTYHGYEVKDAASLYTQLSVGDIYSLSFNNNYDLCGKIVHIEHVDDSKTTRIFVDNYIDDALIENPTRTQNVFRVPSKPLVGYTECDCGPAAHAEGKDTKAAGYAAHAEGYDTLAAGRYAHTEGQSTAAVYSAHAEGMGTNASGQIAHAEGKQTTASGYSSHSEGYLTKAEGEYAHSEGSYTVAEKATAHAEGSRSEATGVAAHAEGTKTQALTEASHAEGGQTVAGDPTAEKSGYEHAEGLKTQALGMYSHSEGYSSKALGAVSHAEGYATTAAEHSAHAEGRNTEALGKQSHAEGWGTTANGPYQHVQGRYNILDSKLAHIVGNGTSKDNRSNAHTLDFDGNAWFAGDITIGAEKKKLATEEYADRFTVQEIDSNGWEFNLPANSEVRILQETSYINILGFDYNTRNVGNDSWSIIFKATDDIQVYIPKEEVIWAINKPEFIAGYTYYLSFMPFGDKILGVYLAKETPSNE